MIKMYLQNKLFHVFLEHLGDRMDYVACRNCDGQ